MVARSRDYMLQRACAVLGISRETAHLHLTWSGSRLRSRTTLMNTQWNDGDLRVRRGRALFRNRQGVARQRESAGKRDGITANGSRNMAGASGLRVRSYQDRNL